MAISKNCQKRVDSISNLIKKMNDSLEQIKILNERVRMAESLLLKVKETAALEIKSAYEEGWKKAKNISDDETGTGKTDNDNKKLELKS